MLGNALAQRQDRLGPVQGLDLALRAPRGAALPDGDGAKFPLNSQRGRVHAPQEWSAELPAAATRLAELQSPKLQGKCGQFALGLSRPKLRTPASGRHPSQSSTGRDSWLWW